MSSPHLLAITLVDHFHLISVGEHDRFFLSQERERGGGKREKPHVTREASGFRYRRGRHQLVHLRILRNAGCNHLLSVAYLCNQRKRRGAKKSDPAPLSPKRRLSARTARTSEKSRVARKPLFNLRVAYSPLPLFVSLRGERPKKKETPTPDGRVTPHSCTRLRYTTTRGETRLLAC